MRGDEFHPDLRRLAAVLPRSAIGPRRLPVMRAMQTLQRGRRGVEVVSVGRGSVRLHHPPAPTAEPGPGLLWIHGGGYVMGHAAQEDGLCRRLADELGAVVAAVDYRLAPEHPFPAPLEDCHDALVWLAARADVDESRIVIGGASAGGGLAAGLALLARDRGEVRPVFQLLTYPMLDDRTVTQALDDRHVRLWNTRANHFGWASYLGQEPGGEGISGLAAPARAEDLTGLPPAWIGVGNFDLFADEDLMYAQRLRDAGVPCSVHVVDGAYHGFDLVDPRAPISRSFRALQVETLASALRG